MNYHSVVRADAENTIFRSCHPDGIIPGSGENIPCNGVICEISGPLTNPCFARGDQSSIG
jgi:hypothetical protein